MDILRKKINWVVGNFHLHSSKARHRQYSNTAKTLWKYLADARQTILENETNKTISRKVINKGQCTVQQNLTKVSWISVNLHSITY